MEQLLELLKRSMVMQSEENGGEGRADDVPAMLSEGEYVFPADVVSFLGQGNTEAGAGVLSKLIDYLRSMQNGSV